MLFSLGRFMYSHLRDDFPILAERINNKPLIYFDNAATTHKPRAVLDALYNFYSRHNANINRGVYLFAEQATQQYEQARATVARFIGAEAHEVIFTSGTTESINFVAATWAERFIGAGDQILITQLEHHANLLPWQQLAQKKNADLCFIPVAADGSLKLEMLESLITNRTKLIAVSQVSNALGVRNDIAHIAEYAKKSGAIVLVDAAQSAPHERLNVATLGADFVAFSGHKMLGPTGIGVLYIKEALHDQVPPYRYGGGMVFNADFDQASWHTSPAKFEAGTPPIAQAIGLAAAIDYLEKNIDFGQLRLHEAALVQRLVAGLSELPRVVIHGPGGTNLQAGHMVTFSVTGIHAHDVAAYLSSQGIFVRAGHLCAQPLMSHLSLEAVVRASFYFYNTASEVDVFISALERVIQQLG